MNLLREILHKCVKLTVSNCFVPLGYNRSLLSTLRGVLKRLESASGLYSWPAVSGALQLVISTTATSKQAVTACYWSCLQLQYER